MNCLGIIRRMTKTTRRHVCIQMLMIPIRISICGKCENNSDPGRPHVAIQTTQRICHQHPGARHDRTPLEVLRPCPSSLELSPIHGREPLDWIYAGTPQRCWIEIWKIWRPGRYCDVYVTLLGVFLSSLCNCSVTVCNCVWMGCDF